MNKTEENPIIKTLRNSIRNNPLEGRLYIERILMIEAYNEYKKDIKAYKEQIQATKEIFEDALSFIADNLLKEDGENDDKATL